MLINLNYQFKLSKTLNTVIRRFYISDPFKNDGKNDRKLDLISESQLKPLTETTTKHAYKDIHPWKNIIEFSNCLYENIIYNKGGLVAINKPYGLGINKPVNDSKEFFRTSLHSFVPESNFYFSEAMSYLKEKLKMPELSIIKAPERYTSGVTLLASNESVTKKIRKSFLHAKTFRKPNMIFRCVVDGLPKPPEDSEHVGFKIVKINGKNEYQICEYSKTQSEKGNMKSIHASYQTLSHNEDLSVALIELRVTSVRSHFPRLFMVRKGVCILGDTLFSNRITTILGKRVLAENPKSTSQISLDPEVCKKLEISVDGNGFASIPVQLHLHKITIHNFFPTLKFFNIVAPLPRHILWTCQNLNFIENKEE